MNIHDARFDDEEEARLLQDAANALADAKAHYDRLVAHRTNRLAVAAEAHKKNLKEMG